MIARLKIRFAFSLIPNMPSTMLDFKPIIDHAMINKKHRQDQAEKKARLGSHNLAAGDQYGPRS